MILNLTNDKKFIAIKSCTEEEYDQLKLSLTKKIDGWRFHPLVKKGLWDGSISFIKGNKIPSGLWKEVVDICKKYNFKCTMNGVTELFNKDIDEDLFQDWVDTFFADLEYKPRQYQIDAAYKIIKYRRCLAELATSAGKTLISYIVIAYLLSELKYKKILMIVPNVNLVLQSSGDFEEYNNKKLKLRIQQIYSGVKLKLESNIVIGTYQSLNKKDSDYYQQFDAVFVDEVQHAKSNSIQSVLNKCWHCDYRFGLSGTIAKTGTMDRLNLMSVLGPMVVQVKANYLQEEGYIAKCFVHQILIDYASRDTKEGFANLKTRAFDRQKIFSLEEKFVTNNNIRLEWLTNFISEIATKNTVVLFHRIEYGTKLYNALRNLKNQQVYFIDGSIDANIRENYKEKINDNNDNNVKILVASYGTCAEGLNLKNVHNIFFVESFKSDVIIKQSIGRGLRLNENKEQVEIYDIVDDIRWNEPGNKWQNYIYRHGIERRRIYDDENFPYEIISKKINI